MKYSEYQGYTGSFEYSVDDKFLFGKVIGLKGLISYEGKAGHALGFITDKMAKADKRWYLWLPTATLLLAIPFTLIILTIPNWCPSSISSKIIVIIIHH